MRAGEKFVVTEFFGGGIEEEELAPAPKLQGRTPELVPPAQSTKLSLVAMAPCIGEPLQVIEVLESICHPIFSAKDIFPSAAGMLSGQVAAVPAVTLC